MVPRRLQLQEDRHRLEHRNRKFALAASTARVSGQARVGLVGHNDVGLYATGFNPTTFRDRLGPEVQSIDMLQLDCQMDALDLQGLSRPDEDLP